MKITLERFGEQKQNSTLMTANQSEIEICLTGTLIIMETNEWVFKQSEYKETIQVEVKRSQAEEIIGVRVKNNRNIEFPTAKEMRFDFSTVWVDEFRKNFLLKFEEALSNIIIPVILSDGINQMLSGKLFFEFEDVNGSHF